MYYPDQTVNMGFCWLTQNEYSVLHSYLVSMMGMPIGELWDLKALSEYCAMVKKYSFLLTSIPLNVPGSIASPPNAIAIF